MRKVNEWWKTRTSIIIKYFYCESIHSTTTKQRYYTCFILLFHVRKNETVINLKIGLKGNVRNIKQDLQSPGRRQNENKLLLTNHNKMIINSQGY